MPWLIPIVLHYSNYMYICICCIPESIATGPVFGIFFKCFFLTFLVRFSLITSCAEKYSHLLSTVHSRMMVAHGKEKLDT